MITFPNAKLNLGLNIVEKRADGYHNLETVFYPIPLEDALEIVPAGQEAPATTLRQSGIAIESAPEDNLVMKAYRMLGEQCSLPPIDIHLYKHIPSGAGLGGGSADAAFMLKLLNERFALGLSTDELEHHAARLGADCAFFVRNRPIFAEGIGNIFTPIRLSLKGYRLALIKPDIFVSTKAAFARVVPQRPHRSLKEIITLPVGEWRHSMANDFEGSVFAQYPQIGALKEKMYEQGALYAAMSGSGSAVFGLFANSAPELKTALAPQPGQFYFETVLA